jgi:hypothetical protein
MIEVFVCGMLDIGNPKCIYQKCPGRQKPPNASTAEMDFPSPPTSPFAGSTEIDILSS